MVLFWTGLWTAVLPGCVPSTDPDRAPLDAGEDDVFEATGSEWSGALMEVSIKESAPNPLAAFVDVIVSRPATVALRWDCEGRTGAQSRPPGAITPLEIWGVPAETECAVEIDAVAADGGRERVRGLSWRTGPLPDGLPSFTVRRGAGEMLPGLTLLSPVPLRGGAGGLWYAFGVDEEGQIVWLYRSENYGSLGRYVRGMSDGTMLLILDTVVRRVTPAGRTISDIGSPDIDETHHDVLPLPNGDMLFLTRIQQDVNVPALGGVIPIVGDRLVRVRGDGGQAGGASGETVWTWSAFDHLDPRRFPGPISRSRAFDMEGLDWTHGNGLALSPDGNSVLYSTRSQSWVVKINLEGGRVEWILGDGGDFALDPAGVDGGESGWFYNQHAPEVQADGSVLLYDNGNERPGADTDPLYSRAVRYALDIGTMTASEVFQAESFAFTDRLGDANLLGNGNYLINFGSPWPDSAEVVEMTPAGEEIWALISPDTDIYCAERMPWTP